MESILGPARVEIVGREERPLEIEARVRELLPDVVVLAKFAANCAWTVIASLAHNLARWTSLIGLPGETLRTARTLRRRLLQIPGT